MTILEGRICPVCRAKFIFVCPVTKLLSKWVEYSVWSLHFSTHQSDCVNKNVEAKCLNTETH